jgi:hypothetical protein
MRASVLCFALKLMRIPMKPFLALLLAVLLPMRGFTFTTHCEPSGQAAEAPHCVDGHPDSDGPHHADGNVPCHAHGCGDCCGGVAAVLTAPRLTVPKTAVALIVGPLARAHPALAIDRLDRPPRKAAC